MRIVLGNFPSSFSAQWKVIPDRRGRGGSWVSERQRVTWPDRSQSCKGTERAIPVWRKDSAGPFPTQTLPFLSTQRTIYLSNSSVFSCGIFCVFLSLEQIQDCHFAQMSLGLSVPSLGPFMGLPMTSDPRLCSRRFCCGDFDYVTFPVQWNFQDAFPVRQR
jgi:hypothetical protein